MAYLFFKGERTTTSVIICQRCKKSCHMSSSVKYVRKHATCHEFVGYEIILSVHCNIVVGGTVTTYFLPLPEIPTLYPPYYVKGSIHKWQLRRRGSTSWHAQMTKISMGGLDWGSQGIWGLPLRIYVPRPWAKWLPQISPPFFSNIFRQTPPNTPTWPIYNGSPLAFFFFMNVSGWIESSIMSHLQLIGNSSMRYDNVYSKKGPGYLWRLGPY